MPQFLRPFREFYKTHLTLPTIVLPISLILLFSLSIALNDSNFALAYPYSPYGLYSATQPLWPVHVPTPTSPTFIAGNAPQFNPVTGRYDTNRMGIVTDVPYDVNDSFSNYDYEETSSEDLNPISNPPGESNLPGYTYSDRGLSPTRLTFHPNIPRRNTIDLPLKPFDYYTQYKDSDEDMFDGRPNARWNNQSEEGVAADDDEEQGHSALTRDTPRSNKPLGRVYGHHRLRSDFTGENEGPFPTVPVHMRDIIRPRTYFTSPYYPGIQRMF